MQKKKPSQLLRTLVPLRKASENRGKCFDRTLILVVFYRQAFDLLVKLNFSYNVSGIYNSTSFVMKV